MASVDKGALFSSDSDGSSGADSDDEVYYAVPKPQKSMSEKNDQTSGNIAHGEYASDEGRGRKEQEVAVASTWKRVNELLRTGELSLTSKLWAEDMEDWETVEQVVKRYPRKLPVASGLLVRRDAVQWHGDTAVEERVD